MEQRGIIVVGASAGGVEALQRLVAGLPADLPAIVLLVLHIGMNDSVLPELLDNAGPLPARHARDGETMQNGRIYVAPPDLHLVVDRGDKLRLIRGAKENFSRPAIDPLFRTAAEVYGQRVIGVILTGNLDDGTSGLQAIKSRGGLAIVQHPDDAKHPSMPASALANVDVDHCLPLAEIPSALVRLSKTMVENSDKFPVSAQVAIEAEMSRTGVSDIENMDTIGKRSPLTCPECHGVLWHVGNGKPHRFRCHTGHAFTSASLDSVQKQALEEALWAAVRSLDESEFFARQAAEWAHGEGEEALANTHRAAAETASQHANKLREMIFSGVSSNLPVAG